MTVDNETLNTAQKDKEKDPIQSEERREAMQKLGRISIYVPATVLTLLTSARATVGSPPGTPD